MTDQSGELGGAGGGGGPGGARGWFGSMRNARLVVSRAPCGRKIFCLYGPSVASNDKGCAAHNRAGVGVDSRLEGADSRSEGADSRSEGADS
eukprot:780353-Prorocentrum_minimum.AAC.1